MTRPDPAAVAAEHGFAQYVRTLGRGPGRSRSLTRAEARAALGMVLRGEADPHQVGAFLMLLRYRGEDPAEMAGLVDAARDAMSAGPPGCPHVALDWPSYGAGRTRGEPWFLLAALALAQAGHAVLMHGTNEFSHGTTVAQGLAGLGLPVCADRPQIGEQLRARRFAYVPLPVLCPGLADLLALRHLLGLRSPINTVARLLNPLDAPAGVDGVFHPAYIAVHLGAAPLLGRGRLVVVKGGGGEAERNPAKPGVAHMFDQATGVSETPLPSLAVEAGQRTLRETWDTGLGAGAVTARATVALGLMALGRSAAEADEEAAVVWEKRLGV